MPPPVLDAPRESGDARNDPATTTSETRVPSEEAETVASSPRSTDGKDESSRRDTTETANDVDDSDDDEATNEKTSADAPTKARATRRGAALSLDDRLEPDPARPWWRAKLASLSKRSFDRDDVEPFEPFEAVERRLTSAAARVADALPADLAAAFADLAALAPSCAQEVGWLARQESSGANRAAEDGTARFERILESIVSETANGASSDGAAPSRDAPRGVVFPRISDATAPAFLFVRGLYGEHYPCYQWDAVEHFRRRGATARLSRAARGAGTTAANAEALCSEILDFADELGADVAGNQTRVVLIGHSKGGVDACAALALHEHRLKDVVSGVITVQTPYGGSPIASDLTSTASLRKITGRALEVLLRAPEGEGARALLPPLLDVTYASRARFLKHHPLPARFHAVSFHTDAVARSSVLAPSAAYVRNAYGAANDGLVCRADAEVPGCLAVRYGAECDHADLAYPRWMSEERYRRYLSAPGGKNGAADDEDGRGTAEDRTELSAGDARAENAMVPPAEARARALRNRETRKKRRKKKKRSATNPPPRGGFVEKKAFEGVLSLSGLVGELYRRAFDEKRRDEPIRETEALFARDGSARDAGPNAVRPSRLEREKNAADRNDASAPPPGAGALLVRAYLALNAAVPERLGRTADQGAIHEALASLLMERAEAARENDFGEW